MQGKIHFHSIDALRFFAFFKVFLLHIPIQGAFPIFAFLKSGGGIGVLFFFTLSGFLITYLLVRDQLENGKVNLKKFFIRRSLRIWPLFYLMVILVFILPYDLKQTLGLHMVGGGYDLDYRFSFTFLENYKMLITDQMPKTTPLNVFWSLCIEEHFYLLWMLVGFLLKGKALLRFMFISVIIGIVSRFVEPMIWNNNHVETTDVFTNIDYFAVGGILGYLVATSYENVSKFILKIPSWIKISLAFSIILFVIYQDVVLPNEGILKIIRPTIIAFIFTILIALFIPIDSTIKIKSRLLAYLGKISYGLYVYHIIVIHMSLQYCFDNDIALNNWSNLSVYILFNLGVTILLSALSFQYFELPFLRLRERLSA